MWDGQISDFAVTFDGQMLPLFALGSGTNFQVYGADISPFAGMVGELRFTVYPGVSPNTTVFLDSILFSNQPIPEPSVSGLILCGALICIWKRWRRRI